MKINTAPAVLWLLIGSVGMLTAQGEKPSSLPKPQDPQREAYARLSRQIFIDPDNDPESARTRQLDGKDEVEAVVRLRDMIRGRIESLLKAPNPTGAAIANSIFGMQSASLATWGANDDDTNTPFADIFVLNGRRNLAVAYTILRGASAIPDSQPYLDFYAQTDEKWVLKGAAELAELNGTAVTDLRGSTLFVQRLTSPLPGEGWYLAWGNRLGDTGTRLNIRLFGFDGKSVRTIWKRDDLTAGTVQVADNSVILEYDKEYHSHERRVREVLHVTSDGLK